MRCIGWCVKKRLNDVERRNRGNKKKTKKKNDAVKMRAFLFRQEKKTREEKKQLMRQLGEYFDGENRVERIVTVWN